MEHIQEDLLPSHRQKLLSRMVRKPGLRGKVDAKCIECIYDPADKGTWRLQVKECTSRACPLYEIRPKPNCDQK